MRENKKTKLRVFWLILVMVVSIGLVIYRSSIENELRTEQTGLTEPVAVMNSVDGALKEKDKGIEIETDPELSEDDAFTDQTGCIPTKVWIVDKASYDEEVWVEGGTKTIHHEEEGHYKITKHDEEGHYETVEKQEWVVDVPAKEATGHYETIHHDAATHEEPIYEEYILGHFEFEDGTNFTQEQTYPGELGDIFEEWGNKLGVSGHWWYTYETRKNGIKEVIDQNAWDEQVWVEDTAAQPEQGHWETTSFHEWVVDKEAWEEKTWVVDKPAWDEEVVIQGHYDTVHHDEEGHWEDNDDENKR